MVISPAWDGVFIENQSLKDAIQPTTSLSISLSGGLRVPEIGAWLLDNSPEITIFAFYPTVDLQVIRLVDNFQVLEKAQTTNIAIPVNFPDVGDYLITASVAGELTQQLVKIVNWQDIDKKENYKYQVININANYQICGSLIQPNI